MEAEGRTGQAIAADFKLLRFIFRWSKLAGKSKDRHNRLRQLVTTEMQYHQDLNLIKEKIVAPLKECGVISQYDENEMFPELQGMIKLSEQIYQSMSLLLSSWDRKTTLIGPEMSQFGKFMIIYSEYFKRYTDTRKKLQLLVQNNEEVKLIEKSIGTPPKIQTFENLIIKPYQRALKYHLLLIDYQKQTPNDHPDKKLLEEAINIFKQANERSNNGMAHKQKSKKLMALDLIFLDIINSSARYFITEAEAIILNQEVKCYLLSDYVLISKKEKNQEVQYIRIQLNESSYTSQLEDGIYLKNRLLICGKRICIHLEFKDRENRTHFHTFLNGILIDIYKKSLTKVPQTVRQSTFIHPNLQQSDMNGYRESCLSNTSLRTTQSESFSRPQSILPRPYAQSVFGQEANPRISTNGMSDNVYKPPKIIVLGAIKRYYSSTVCKLYFLVKMQMPIPKQYHQILYLDQSQIDKILKISKIVYFQERELVQSPSFRQLQEIANSSEEDRSFEHLCLYYTLLLNTIFRHPNIIQRLDIYAHLMGISEGFWIYLKRPNNYCPCFNCRQAEVMDNIYKYKMELENRYNTHNQIKKSFYCPYRTFHVQDSLLSMDPSEIQLGVDRLLWIRCEKGCLQYQLLDNSLLFNSPCKTVVLEVACGSNSMKIEKNISKQDRVGQIKISFSRTLNMELAEYQMFMVINNVWHLLGDDQIVWNLLENQQKPETGIASFFRNTFGNKEDLQIRLVLKRVWWFIDRQPDIENLKKIDLKMNLFMESLASRSKEQQIQFSVKDMVYFQACYFLYKRTKQLRLNASQQIQYEISESDVESLQPPKKWKLMTSSLKKDKVSMVKDKMNKIVEELIKNKVKICPENIFEYMVKIFRDKPIWGVYFFEGTTEIDGNKSPVQVGFDLFSFIVKEPGKITNLYSCKLSDALEKIVISSWWLKIKENLDEYLVEGSQFAQMLPLLELYVQYAKTFKYGK